MSRIPVVFTPDDNFIIPTCVAVYSMLESKRTDTEYYFYFVVGHHFNSENICYIEKIRKLFIEFAYEVIAIDDASFKNMKINTKHLSTSAFYRLFLGSILADEEKVMYHDGDILVLDDLSDYFKKDFEDCYVSGVPSIYAVQNGLWRHERVEKWGFPHTDDYIFSGDLIINLSLIRADGLEEKFASHMKLGYPSEDQDVINRCCIGKIGKLPLRFCMLNRWIGNDILNSFEINPYSSEEISEAQQKPAIIHFAGADAKPWKNTRIKYGDDWWRILKSLLSIEEFSQWKTRAEESTKERDWIHYKNILDNNFSQLNTNQQMRKIVIYGFGKAGREFYSTMVNNNYRISAIIDANALKINQGGINIPIITPEDAKHKYGNAMIFITVQGDFEQICENLRSIGYSNAVFICYIQKGDFYYQVIDDKYKMYEDEDILRKKGIWAK